MPLFFFHVRDGSDRTIDPEGSDLSDLATAHVAAIDSARQMAEAVIMDAR
jgi:hypothetical protein